mmetsp:Transcript_25725/g.73944  ORF Transcript_25725/g.73944 Transcript_25725/m.73944 type:complete len:136 (-) Transcript_25725:177-584(-)
MAATPGEDDSVVWISEAVSRKSEDTFALTLTDADPEADENGDENDVSAKSTVTEAAEGNASVPGQQNVADEEAGSAGARSTDATQRPPPSSWCSCRRAPRLTDPSGTQSQSTAGTTCTWQCCVRRWRVTPMSSGP